MYTSIHRTTSRFRPVLCAAIGVMASVLAVAGHASGGERAPALATAESADAPAAPESSVREDTDQPCEVRWDCREFPQFHCDGEDAVRYAGLCEEGRCRYVELRMRCREDTVCRFTPRGPGCGPPVAEPEPAPARQGNPLGELPTAARQLLLNASVRFAVDSTGIDRWDARLLDEVAEALREHPELRVRVDGHTDDTGSRRHNIRLSLERAEAVRSYLVSRGVAAERIQTRGLGPDRPLVPNTSDRNHAFNRRAEIVVVGAE